MTAEAGVRSVPVLSLVTHLALVNANSLSARIAVLGKHAVEATEAVRSAFSHDVPLPS
jgi:hypothetical protein